MMKEMVDKEKLTEHFKNKDYIYCINVLRNDIKEMLVTRIKTFKPDYTYTNLFNLKENCYTFLNDKEKLYVTILCRYSEKEYPSICELNSLLDIYNRDLGTVLKIPILKRTKNVFRIQISKTVLVRFFIKFRLIYLVLFLILQVSLELYHY